MLQLKHKQKNDIRFIYNGKDVFLWLPTGYGQSIICYQVLPFLFDFKTGLSPTEYYSVVVIVPPLAVDSPVFILVVSVMNFFTHLDVLISPHTHTPVSATH